MTKPTEKPENNIESKEPSNWKIELEDGKVVGDDYDPNDDPDNTDTLTEELEKFRDKMMPYQKYIMITGIIILIMLVVFLGYAYGGLKVCSSLDGLLDNKFKCHLGLQANVTYSTPQSFMPEFIFNVT